ncbi:N-acetylmuramoyl-L-alanine amidase family protein [Tumebacillus permanentifrigoris]|uniref:N-acetylmuramoyl-L-alanine amidase n=1 Tax=Tumebacillus permanentifrigoris TaxID=378543 RepID=A0A316D3C6_9BACL|nr:N-acetylmuramoyl-L-alanine amidase [Tumebacillus permanentifrigoris]PWK05706.1 N-acetylmuramoyl-L-alanine amidase [Tumebacillus permanentifrigoris]
MRMGRFALTVVFFLIGVIGLYSGLGQFLTQPMFSWALPLKGEVIALDAGHGGVDPGAVGPDGALEKGVTLAVATKLQDLLTQAGAHVVMIRDDDRDLAQEQLKGYSRRKSQDLKERARIVREGDAGLLISLHCNAVTDPTVTGTQTLYNGEYEESKWLATEIQTAFQETLGLSREVTRRDDIYVLKRAMKPGALVELGFISNPKEAALLQDSGHQDLLALSVYKGIVSYYAHVKQR